jgi:hypothetical protein
MHENLPQASRDMHSRLTLCEPEWGLNPKHKRISAQVPRASDSKVEMRLVISRQVLSGYHSNKPSRQAIGFSVLGRLIIVNRHQADLNGLSGGSIAMVGGISAFFI